MSDRSPWNIYGPFYAKSALERCLMPVTDDLITVTAKEGEILFPQVQFDVDEYGSTILGRRERVIKVYGDVLLGAVQSGEISDLEALQLIIGPVSEVDPSLADIIADPNTSQDKVDKILASIASTLSRWRTGSF